MHLSSSARGAGLALILVGAAAHCRPSGTASERFLSLGTAGTGGIYYPLGGALASRLTAADGRHRYTAEVTGGSLENVNRVARGEMDLGMAIATTIYEAYHGGADHPTPIRSLRAVAPLYPNLTHVLVSRRSNARGLGDLRGKRVSVGAAGSGTEQVARQLLAAYGLGYEDIEVRYLSFRESADALRDGAIEGAILSVGYPAAAVLEATTTGAGARLVPIDEMRRRALVDQFPYYALGAIPAGVYPGVDESVPTVAVLNWIVATEEIDSTVVRGVLDVLAGERAALAAVHGIAEQIDLGALTRSPIPLHPAAEQWLQARP